MRVDVNVKVNMNQQKERQNNTQLVAKLLSFPEPMHQAVEHHQHGYLLAFLQNSTPHAQRECISTKRSPDINITTEEWHWRYLE